MEKKTEKNLDKNPKKRNAKVNPEITTEPSSQPENQATQQPNEPESQQQIELHLHINQQAEILEQSSEESLPYIIKIRNLTDSKLEWVKLFDYEFEKQDKIRYECLNYGVSYADLLRFKDVKKTIIGKIYAYSTNYDQLQIPTSYTYKNFNGKMLTIPERFTHDPMQNQSNIILHNSQWEMSIYTQYELGFLFPDTTIIIRLYPKHNEY